MLYTETVEPGTFAILTKLQELPELREFYLVGGTALSLQYGHRKSDDIDLFGNANFDKELLLRVLESAFGKDFEYAGNPVAWGLFCYIQNIKVDIIQYKHPTIAAPLLIDEIRMYSEKDIAAMKINAILGRGKKKDFWDMYELLQHYSLSEIIEFYFKKFPKQQLLITIPEALSYFTDAEESEDPVSLKEQTWDGVKDYIQNTVNNFLK